MTNPDGVVVIKRLSGLEQRVVDFLWGNRLAGAGQVRGGLMERHAMKDATGRMPGTAVQSATRDRLEARGKE